MLQMAAAYASAINGGSYFEPHVMKQIQNEQGSVIRKNNPVLVNETVSETTSSFIKQSLLRTVNEGTGKAAAVMGYDIAGKTGTAEKLPRGTKDYVLSFCGFAPATNPEVLIYVVIDTPHVEEQSHSSYASGVFRQIMADILPYLDIFADIEDETASGGAASELPQEEGINRSKTGTAGSDELETAAAKIYETEEYWEAETENGSDSSGALPKQQETSDPVPQTSAAVKQTQAAETTAAQAAGDAQTKKDPLVPEEAEAMPAEVKADETNQPGSGTIPTVEPRQ